MRVQVLYFGVLRERFGVSEELAELADGATVGDLLRILREQTSKDRMDNKVEKQLWRSLAVAINREYGSPAVVLHDGDEVALLPPVSGGSFAEGEKRVALAGAEVVRVWRGTRVAREGDPLRDGQVRWL